MSTFFKFGLLTALFLLGFIYLINFSSLLYFDKIELTSGEISATYFYKQSLIGGIDFPIRRKIKIRNSITNKAKSKVLMIDGEGYNEVDFFKVTNCINGKEKFDGFLIEDGFMFSLYDWNSLDFIAMDYDISYSHQEIILGEKVCIGRINFDRFEKNVCTRN